MILTITKATSTDKRKDGSLLKDKNGKQYYRVGIKTQEYGDKWLNGFLYFLADDWVGQKKELEVSEEEYNGQKQLRFQQPRAFKITQEMWDLLIERMSYLESKLKDEPPETDEPPFDEEIPF